MAAQIKLVATSIRKDILLLPVVSPLRCIYKVPEHIRKVNEEAYRPWTVSIGPIYHGDPSLQAMQQQKLRHLQRFLEQGNQAYSLEYYVDIIRKQEAAIRSCYAEKVSLSSNDFIRMILVDAAFVIGLFMWSSFKFPFEDHPVEKMVEVFFKVDHDWFLEENQLPFFILKDLYDTAFGVKYPQISFIDLTWSCLSSSVTPGNKVAGTKPNEKIMQNASNVKHFVDFLRICCLPSEPRKQPDSIGDQYPQFPLSVTELSTAGVKFVSRKSKSLLDIRFVHGVLEIPKITVQDSTESVFRSIIFFELSHHFMEPYFVRYILFLDGLINSSKDVEILVKNGIIENWLGSDEAVVNIVNSMGNRISLCSSNYYGDVCRRLNEYANTSWHQWKATLRKDYFNHPWAIISVIYAVVLLLLTLLQTISGFTSK